MSKLFKVLLMVICMPWGCAWADGTTPLQLSVWSPLQLFPRAWDVIGLRCSGVYAQNRHVYGLDAGLFNSATATSGGLQVGAGNAVSALGFGFVVFDAADKRILNLDEAGINRKGETYAGYTGLQLSLLFNHADDLCGLQFAGLGNRAVIFSGVQVALGSNEGFCGRGWQVGLLNETLSAFYGVQSGGVNMCGQALHGLQIGAVNICDGEMHGLQLGLINFAYARGTAGVQVGLINFMRDNPVSFCPLLNAHF